MTEHDNAYTSLVEADDDARWAFGTSFDDPLAGVDTTVPDGVDSSALAAYCLMLADDALVLAQRLAEWTTHAPELEEEVALANIGLDLLGQARLLLARAAAADPSVVPGLPDGSPVPPDDRLAYFRDADAFRNVHLVEQPNGDFTATMGRLLVFSAWRLALLEHLRTHADPVLAAVAEKAVKEVRYHREHAARWCVTLAQGTDLSRERMIAGFDTIWPDVPELEGTDPGDAFEEAMRVVDQVLDLAGLQRPSVTPGAGSGRDGIHTEPFDELLTEMQGLAREHPMGRW
ncbi:1,2-phenylacetyl-CoA epoxidase subunit PaaC [Aeromicrobium sp.]|uniref:1,2-phenylacetyl-CoA epoxidase subunit PaaC n=1 Tax=Aeromicrobium sp. TaxID=1871063 RepID=UPI003D6AD33E